MDTDSPWRRKKRLAAENAKLLYDIVKDSSDKNRNYFIAWMILLAYVIVTVAGTTDLQLLVRTDGISLPLLGVQLPVVGFYLVAPILVFAIHFNLLQNLDSHAYRLDQWSRALDRKGPARADSAVSL